MFVISLCLMTGIIRIGLISCKGGETKTEKNMIIHSLYNFLCVLIAY